MSEVSPVVLRPAEAPPERPFQVAREELGGPVALNLWSVVWSLPDGEAYDQQVLTHPSAHVTVENGEPWVHGVVTRVFSRRLTGSGRVVGVLLPPRLRT